MKNTTYGFPHIEQRCKAHNITTNLPIEQENIADLDDVLEEKSDKSTDGNFLSNRLDFTLYNMIFNTINQKS